MQELVNIKFVSSQQQTVENRCLFYSYWVVPSTNRGKTPGHFILSKIRPKTDFLEVYLIDR